MSNRVLRRLHLQTVSNVAGNTDIRGDVITMIAEKYEDLFYMADWKWRQKQGVIRTIANYSTGTASNTGAVVTFSGGGSPLATWLGGKFRYTNTTAQNDIARITTVVPTTSITVDLAYASNESNKTFSLFFDECPMASDFDKPIAGTRYFDAAGNAGSWNVDLVSIEELLRRRALRGSDAWTAGEPKQATIFGIKTDSGTFDLTRYCILDPAPDDVYNIRYYYVRTANTLSSNTDTLLMPDRFVNALIQMVMADAYRDLKDDPRAQIADQTATRLLQQFQAELDATSTQAGFVPTTSDRTLQAANLPPGVAGV
jgi:hypothetical protein